MIILGVSGLYHDSAAAILHNGNIVAAAQEERFSRKKHDSRMPVHAILYCLKTAGVSSGEIDAVVFFDKPITKFTRLLTTYSQVAPKGLKSFLMGAPVWLKEKAWVGVEVERILKDHGYGRPKKFYFPEHHYSHGASAFFPSPFEEAAVITADGVGEWACTTIGCGEGNEFRIVQEQHFPHSIGLLYSTFTYYTGFKVNSGEYKLMGLAPYGEPIFADKIRDELIQIRDDGSIRLNLEYFGFLDELKMTSSRFDDLFGGPRREPESELSRREMDLAASVQVVTEEIMLKTARYARAITGKPNLCMSGGVALNCVANGKIVREGIFDKVWIQPASGDAGGALGAAQYIWHHVLKNKREVNTVTDGMSGSALGPEFSNEEIRSFLDKNDIPYQAFESDELRNKFLAKELDDGRVLGMFQGRMEFGPRALGNRSIIADARSPKMQSYINLATKFRESFRPFAPIVLREAAADCFEAIHESPYMLLVDQVRPERCIPRKGDERELSMTDWVNRPRSDLPAITHVDFSARIQTVDPDRNLRLHQLLQAFNDLTGCPALINTSFNVRSEPIVCTPEDAYRCFMRTGIDTLVLEGIVLTKEDQPEWEEDKTWQEEFGLD